MKTNVAIAVGVIGFLATAGIAFAQTGSVISTAAVPSPMVLHVNKDGSVLLRGTVSSVASGSLTVKSWGGDWTVNVPTTASVLPAGSAISNFHTGDFVGVQGTIDANGNWTVDASLIRDWTERQALNQEVKTNVQAVHTIMADRPRITQGTLSGLDATAQTFTLTSAAGTAYSVSLASGAQLLAKNWTTLDFSKVSNGDTVRVYGTVASSSISASIFRDISVN